MAGARTASWRRAVFDGALDVAVKKAHVDEERAAKLMLRELRVLQELHHPHIVLLLGVADNTEDGDVWVSCSPRSSSRLTARWTACFASSRRPSATPRSGQRRLARCPARPSRGCARAHSSRLRSRLKHGCATSDAWQRQESCGCVLTTHRDMTTNATRPGTSLGGRARPSAASKAASKAKALRANAHSNANKVRVFRMGGGGWGRGRPSSPPRHPSA